jgi:predicted metal-dependent peptidase
VSKLQKALNLLQMTPKYRTMGALLATMKIIPDPDIPTANTDCLREIRVNLNWLEQFSVEQIAFVLAHEGVHKFGNFMVRFEVWSSLHKRIDRSTLFLIFNVAHDYLINHWLTHEWKLPRPDGMLYDTNYTMAKTTLEQLATSMLPDQPGQKGGGDAQGSEGSGKESESGSSSPPEGDTSKGKGDGTNAKGDSEAGDGASGRGIEHGEDVFLPKEYADESGERSIDKILSAQERHKITQKVQRDIANADRLSKMASGGAGVGDETCLLAKEVEKAMAPPVRTLEAELNMLATVLNRDGIRSYACPHRTRSWPTGLQMPGPRERMLDDIIVVADSSGSVSDVLWRYFMETFVRTMQKVNFSKVHVLHCSTRIHDDRTKVYVPRDFRDLDNVDTSIRGSGGTRITPVFRWMEQRRIRKPAAMVYFTDGGVSHSEVAAFGDMWRRTRFSLLWALCGYNTDTFINWVTVNDRIGTVCALPPMVES